MTWPFARLLNIYCVYIQCYTESQEVYRKLLTGSSCYKKCIISKDFYDEIYIKNLKNKTEVNTLIFLDI